MAGAGHWLKYTDDNGRISSFPLVIHRTKKGVLYSIHGKRILLTEIPSGYEIIPRVLLRAYS